MKRIIGSVAWGTLPTVIAWLGGMDFVRSPELAHAVGFGVGIALAAYICPVWGKP